MKNTTYASETAVLLVTANDVVRMFENVIKVVVKGSTAYVHVNCSGYDDVRKIDDVVSYSEYHA